MKHYRRKKFDFGNFEITRNEIILSISIIVAMFLIGFWFSGNIAEHQMDQNEIYNKAAKINTADLFQYGMSTNVGNAFVYGNLEAVDTVTYPEIGGEYIYIEKVEEHYNRHEREVTKKDKDGKEYKETEIYYQWDVEHSESKHAHELMFQGITFPYNKIDIPSSEYIETLKGDRVYSWHSGEFVKVRFKYYGCQTKYVGTIFTDLRDETISDNTRFYRDMDIDKTIDRLESGGGLVLFWIFWIVLTAGVLYGFYYLDNDWLH